MKTKNLTFIAAFIILLFISLNKIYGQATTVSPINFSFTAATDYLGWSTANDLNFKIGVVPTQYMQINGTTSPGWVGIGTAFSPGHLLDVNGGDINVNSANNGYMINSQTVLWNNGIPSSIFAGVFAGSPVTTGAGNTFIGTFSGSGTHTGNHNTFVGYATGNSNNTAVFNTFLGAFAGFNNDNTGLGSANENTFLGNHAGYSNTDGPYNVITGHNAGHDNTTGGANCFYGKQSGFSNTTGWGNCYYGAHAGHEGNTSQASHNTFSGNYCGFTNQDSANAFYGDSTGYFHLYGYNNTYIGTKAQLIPSGYYFPASRNNLTNSAAIGANTIVPQDNQMILGDSLTNVGIGLSDDHNGTLGVYGPRNKLEINAGMYPATAAPFGFDPPPSALLPGYSGLQFRDLISTCSTVPNPGLGVLSVGTDGTVIYVPSGGSTSPFGGACGNTNNMTTDWEIPMALHNYVFTNSNVDPSNVNNVGIGLLNGICAPVARLDVLAANAATSPGTIGINVLNTDNSADAAVGPSSIGLRSTVVGNTSSVVGNATIAGWFEAIQNNPELSSNYAIVVPNGGMNGLIPGGLVSIGYANPTGLATSYINPTVVGSAIPTSTVLLDVNGNGRFADLPSNLSTLSTYPPIQMVVCDATGELFVQAGSPPIGFGYCPVLPQLLGNDAGLDLHNQNLYFAGNYNGTATNNIVVGANCGYGPTAKLEVYQNSLSTTGSIGIASYNYDVSSFGSSIGVLGQANGILGSSGAQTGGSFFAQGDGSNIGVYGVGGNYAGSLSTFSYGGYFLAEGSPQSSYNTGLYGFASGGTVGITFHNIGVLGYVDKLANLGINNIAVYGDLGMACYPCSDAHIGPDYAGYFNGDVVTTMSNFLLSDSSLKHDIQDLTNPLSVISQLHPKTYQFNQQQNLSMQLPYGTHAGILAQDLENVLPQLTKNCVHPARFDSAGNMTSDSIKYKAVNYTELIPYLIGGIKQLDSTNQALQNQINNLTTQINNCCNNGSRTSNGGDNNNNGNGNNINIHTIDLNSMSSSPILFQNQPNPFGGDGGTKIKYFIPGNITNAQISFFDEYGNAMSVFTITESGMGELNVTSANLANGVYSYSLIINNKVIDTKRMVKTQ